MKIINKSNNIQITDLDLDILKFIKQNFNNSDIMIIDKSLIKLSLIKKIVKICSTRANILASRFLYFSIRYANIHCFYCSVHLSIWPFVLWLGLSSNDFYGNAIQTN